MLTIVVEKSVCVIYGDGEVVIIVALVDMLRFLMDPERVFLDGDIVRNKY